MTTQRLLLQAIDTGTAGFGLYADDPQPAMTALSDVRALAGRVLALATTQELAECLPADLLEPYNELLSMSVSDVANPSARLGFTSPPSAIATAVGLTAAVNILNQRSVREAGQAMRWLISARQQTAARVNPSMLAQWGIGTSAVFRSAQLAAVGPMLRPSEQLRHRVTSSRPDTLEAVSARTLDRSRSVPSVFWPAWSLRISPTQGSLTRLLRPALSCVLLIIGNRLEYADVSRRLSTVVKASRTSWFLQKLAADPAWPDILAALTRLADYLDECPAPIDYSRRRRLDYTGILPDAYWTEICRRTALLPGKGVRVRFARCLLYERLSGLPAEHAPSTFNITGPVFRAGLTDFATQLTPELVIELDRVADQFLQVNSIHEPLSWQPPNHLLEGLNFPGRDPETIDVNLLHGLIREPGMTLPRAAESLGTTSDTIRYLMECHPAIPVPMTIQRARAVGDVKRWARINLTANEVSRLLEEEGLSLQQIGARHGIGRRAIEALAREYSVITHRPRRPGPGPTPRVVISRDWLYDQHVNSQRTLTEIARETGMSQPNMVRWAARLNIPVRPGGGRSHTAALNIAKQAATCPSMLQKVLTGAGAWERLDRFVAIADQPSMTAGAAALGINRNALVLQINRIERELDGPVFFRGNHGRPMRLTDLGHQLLVAIAQAQPLRGLQS
ncbi:LysR family transcriptional regulator [Nonomuraea terrae]|uniref:LysR family transcriptional regulator n=1 Tax=Nonomuraea terrae TaxID=2530383 RepID=UPI0037A94227